MSKSLSATECNYEIYDKELLAIMLALDEWCHYLMGRRRRRSNLDGSPKPPVFPKASEAEPTTSALGNRASGVSLRPPSQARCPEQEGRLIVHRDDHDQGKDDNGDIVVHQPAHSGRSSCPRPTKFIRRSRKLLNRKSYGMRGSKPLSLMNKESPAKEDS